MHRRHAVNLPPGPGRTRSLQHHCCTCACSTAPARSTRSTTQVARELTDFGLRLLAGWNHWWPYSCWSLRTPSTPQWLQVADRLPRYACRSHAQPSTHVSSHTPRHSSSRPWSTSAVLCALTEGDHMISIHPWRPRTHSHFSQCGKLDFADLRGSPQIFHGQAVFCIVLYGSFAKYLTAPF